MALLGKNNIGTATLSVCVCICAGKDWYDQRRVCWEISWSNQEWWSTTHVLARHTLNPLLLFCFTVIISCFASIELFCIRKWQTGMHSMGSYVICKTIIVSGDQN